MYLKIKDNVDLKELEKFGFKYFINGCGTYGYSYDTGYGFVTIIEEDKEFSECRDERRIPKSIPLDILYDLIKADLIEKVEE